MAKLRFEIEGTPSTVAFPTFVAATTGLLKLLRELDTIISAKFRGTLQWYVSSLSSNGNLEIDVVSRVRPVPRLQDVPTDVGPRVASSLVKGFDNIQNRGSSPPYLSEYGLRNLGEMLQILNRYGVNGYTFRAEGLSLSVFPSAVVTMNKLLPIKR